MCRMVFMALAYSLLLVTGANAGLTTPLKESAPSPMDEAYADHASQQNTVRAVSLRDASPGEMACALLRKNAPKSGEESPRLSLDIESADSGQTVDLRMESNGLVDPARSVYLIAFLHATDRETGISFWRAYGIVRSENDSATVTNLAGKDATLTPVLNDADAVPGLLTFRLSLSTETRLETTAYFLLVEGPAGGDPFLPEMFSSILSAVCIAVIGGENSEMGINGVPPRQALGPGLVESIQGLNQNGGYLRQPRLVAERKPSDE